MATKSILHLPMEPIGNADPGPNAIFVGLDPERVPSPAHLGVPARAAGHGHQQSHGQPGHSEPETMLKVLRRHAGTGLSFVDSRTSPFSVGDALAAQLGAPACRPRRLSRQQPGTGSHLAPADRSRAATPGGGATPWRSGIPTRRPWQCSIPGCRPPRRGASSIVSARNSSRQALRPAGSRSQVNACTGANCQLPPPDCRG